MWVWVHNDWIFIFGWTIPLILNLIILFLQWIYEYFTNSFCIWSDGMVGFLIHDLLYLCSDSTCDPNGGWRGGACWAGPGWDFSAHFAGFYCLLAKYSASQKDKLTMFKLSQHPSIMRRSCSLTCGTVSYNAMVESISVKVSQKVHKYHLTAKLSLVMGYFYTVVLPLLLKRSEYVFYYF